MRKRKIVDWCVNFVDGWNTELHNSIESRVFAHYRETFPSGMKNHAEQIEKSREFYYARMTTIANLMIAIAALVIGLVALLVSFVALVLS